jgi:VWFA-related protein
MVLVLRTRARTLVQHLWCVVLIGPVVWAAGQTGPSSAAQNPPAAPPQAQTEENHPIETLKVNVDVVNIYCTVKDKHGALVPNLKKEDFELKEDGSKQNIKYFNAETDQPLTLGILMDTSGSLMQVIPAEKEIGGAFLSQVLTPKDIAFFMTFDVDVELAQDFTSSVHLLREAMNSAHVNVPPSGPTIARGPFPTSNDTRSTALYDAIYLAANEKLSREVGRKAMIIMSDGVDEGSKIRLNEAVETAQKADAICYVLLFTRGIYGTSGEGYMRKVAEETGGRVFEIDRIESLKTAFDQIAAELRTQYGIGYTPTNSKKDGSFRKIEIHAPGKDGYKVQARRGYYAIPHS